MVDRPELVVKQNKLEPKKYPATAIMVNNAIENLQDQKGSSMKAITKYIGANYPVDMKKTMPYIKRYLKQSMAKGIIIKPKGIGLGGSFKLAAKIDKKKKTKPPSSSSSKPKIVQSKEKGKQHQIKKPVKTAKTLLTPKLTISAEPKPIKRIKIAILNGSLIQRKSLALKLSANNRKSIVAKKKSKTVVEKTKQIEKKTTKKSGKGKSDQITTIPVSNKKIKQGGGGGGGEKGKAMMKTKKSSKPPK